jgi:hypothetical protein
MSASFVRAAPRCLLLLLRRVVRALAVGVRAFDVRAAIGALLWRWAIGGPRTISAFALRQALTLLRGRFGGRLLSSTALLVALGVRAFSLSTLLL